MPATGGFSLNPHRAQRPGPGGRDGGVGSPGCARVLLVVRAHLRRYLLRGVPAPPLVLHGCARVRAPPLGGLRYAARPLSLADLLAVLPFYLPAAGLDLRFLR